MSAIPPLCDGYSHARKAYGLVSALLMAWELIGVELDASPIESVKLILKSPQAAPYVLRVLILYFSFRLTIEWYQTDVRRRSLRASRIDFAAAHAIATAAVLLYVVQTLSKVQVADKISTNVFGLFVVWFLVGQSLYRLLRRWERLDRFEVLMCLLMVALSIGAIVLSAFETTKEGLGMLLVGSALGLILGFSVYSLVDRSRTRFPTSVKTN
jgi:hypothetical protein